LSPEERPSFENLKMEQDTPTRPNNTVSLAALALSLLAIFAPFIVSWLEADSKNLTVTYESISPFSILQDSQIFPPELEVQYEGEEVENFQMYWLIFENKGSIPIRKEDFEGPIRVELTEGTRMLTASLCCTEPSILDININMETETEAITIKPLLINPGDRFCLQIAGDGANQEPIVKARIAGIPRIEPTEDALRPKLETLFTVTTLCLFWLIITVFVISLLPMPDKIKTHVASALIILWNACGGTVLVLSPEFLPGPRHTTNVLIGVCYTTLLIAVALIAYKKLRRVRLFWNDAERRGNNGLARCQRETTEDGASFGM
jgi:hypothetical protein